ncbi:MAG: hypothetical protein GY937_07160 [bacterium]|nr:hypothetical protein [bacterium]
MFRRESAKPKPDSPVEERVLDAGVDWASFDFIVLAFEKKASSVDDLRDDETLGRLLEIPCDTTIASVVLSPSTELLDGFLEEHSILHFVSTPAAALPGAVALIRDSIGSEATRKPLFAAFPELKWRVLPEGEYARLGFLIIGAGMAAASLAHLATLLGGPLSRLELEHLQDVLGDAQRLMALTEGDGFEAFSRVATPGGFTEKIHNKLFTTEWPLKESS